MSETTRTKQMRTTLLNHFNSWKDELSYVSLSKEVLCNKGQCKCDLAGYEYQDNKPYASIGIEIKQSRGDFHSGCGLNFVFDVNYICVPSELVGEAIIYLQDHELSDVGIIEYLGNNTVRLVKQPHYNLLYSQNRNNCIRNTNWFDNLHYTPHSAYSFNKKQKYKAWYEAI